jgi:uncharacterized 2Fe-2S/4Fe-4S cluster protein (DUF4445 family)
MAKLTVLTNDLAREVSLSPGASVRELLETAGLHVRSGCRGNGACGLCLVQVAAGNVRGPTKTESLVLSPEQLERNIRLACQLMPESDLSIRVVPTASKSEWRDLSPTLLPCAPSHLPPLHNGQPTKTTYGLAVDLGTTHISLSLWDLQHGERRSSRVGLNPQSHYGSDVVTRLLATGESSENAQRIARIALDAIREAFLEMCWRDGFSPAAVTRVTIVGNTPMLALLTETDAQLLWQPDSWTRPMDWRPDVPRHWASELGISPQATMEVIPPCAGFVGSDLLAGVLATRLADQPGGLLIDFGTNSEMALWDGRTLWITSAAGGPAFETAQVQCGMPAEPGAIYRVDRQQDSAELQFRVIGEGPAKGLCGSGLIDLIACLRGTEELTRTGRFARQSLREGFVIREKPPTLRLSHLDVDMFQRAKAAIEVGIKTLLASAQMDAAKLSRICVCGVFGQHLNCRNAQAIGLLPGVPSSRVELCGNTALAGCEWLLLSAARAGDLAKLREQMTVINLSQSPEFERFFLESLYLEPIEADAT